MTGLASLDPKKCEPSSEAVKSILLGIFIIADKCLTVCPLWGGSRWTDIYDAVMTGTRHSNTSVFSLSTCKCQTVRAPRLLLVLFVNIKRENLALILLVNVR